MRSPSLLQVVLAAHRLVGSWKDGAVSHRILRLPPGRPVAAVVGVVAAARFREFGLFRGGDVLIIAVLLLHVGLVFANGGCSVSLALGGDRHAVLFVVCCILTLVCVAWQCAAGWKGIAGVFPSNVQSPSRCGVSVCCCCCLDFAWI